MKTHAETQAIVTVETHAFSVVREFDTKPQVENSRRNSRCASGKLHTTRGPIGTPVEFDARDERNDQS